jgi:hypothetical protein
MKNRLLVMAALFMAVSGSVKAQIQKGNVMVGGDIANLSLDLGQPRQFAIDINPKAAWFIRDNVALGAYGIFDLATIRKVSTSVTYGVGALGRYYFSDKNLDVVKHLRLFAEANIGIQGVNVNNHNNTVPNSTTNGLGFGFGPGAAYFITPEIGFETLLKYNGNVGFGSNPYASNLSINVGLQIYLPSKKLKQVSREARHDLREAGQDVKQAGKDAKKDAKDATR